MLGVRFANDAHVYTMSDDGVHVDARMWEERACPVLPLRSFTGGTERSEV